MAQPAYSYGTQATVHGSKPTDSYYVLDTNNDPSGGTTIVGDLDVTGSITAGGPLLTLGPTANSQLLVEDTSGNKVKIQETAGVGTILQSNTSGIVQAPYLQFDGDLNILSAGNVIEAVFPAVAGPVTFVQGMTATDISTITRPSAGADAFLKVVEFTGDGVGIRAADTTGITRIQPITNNAVGTGGLVLSQNGDVKEEGVFTAGRPAGDTTNPGFMGVQNGAGFGMGFRVAAGAVAPGATIERVTGGGGSGVADITLGSTGKVTFAEIASAPLFNLSGAGGSNYGLINCTGGGAGTPVANTSVTANTIIHLTPVIGTILTNPISYTLSTGVGFTIFNFNAGAVDVVFSITALSAST